MINILKKLQLALEKINNNPHEHVLLKSNINEFTRIIDQIEKLEMVIEPNLDKIQKLPSIDKNNYDLSKLYTSLDNADNVVIPLMEIYIVLTKSIENIYKLDNIVKIPLYEKDC
jgi:hypothetical protein